MLDCQNRTLGPDYLPRLGIEDGCWVIDLRFTDDEGHTFSIEIDRSHIQPTNRVTVKAHRDGEYWIAAPSQAEYHALGNRLSRDGWPKEEIERRLLIVELEVLWRHIDDAIARWNAFLFLFAPAVSM